MLRRLWHNKLVKCAVKNNKRAFSSNRANFIRILGIETSCDDTGCAIVDDTGQILGECLESQQDIHVENGGILPPIARDLHVENIEKVVSNALSSANLELTEVDAIAATVKPGLPLSLLVGTNYGKKLALEANKPFIPIHHMEAHALTARMIEKVEFPFMVLLISGGHCLLGVARSVDKFLLLGRTLDDAPGEALDKIARRLKLTNLVELRGLSGGAALSAAANGGDPNAFPVAEPLLQYKDCNFSFAGIKNSTRSLILQQEKEHDIEGDQIIPRLADVCASVQMAMARHLSRRIFRAFEYASISGLIPADNQTLVVSGGVAASVFFRRVIKDVCRRRGYRMVVPPPKLCTDNGAMIAWNGMEKFLAGIGLYHENLQAIDIQPKCPFGEDISEAVQAANIKSVPLKFNNLSLEKQIPPFV